MTLQKWVGRTREVEDIATPRLLASFEATLGPHAVRLDEAPPGLHWCLTPDIADASELGPDGHAAKGGFLPPVPLPRRMWAGSDMRFLAPIRSGDTVRRRSTISAVEEKQGRSGPLTFVTVRHEIANAAGPVVEEDQIIVYRAAEAGVPAPAQPAAPRLAASHERIVDVDPVLLFRYSALTFNGHRIHYDAPYAANVEHYPGLVIHGPLQATLLMNFAAVIAGQAPRRFSFRGVRPAIGPQALLLSGTALGKNDMQMEVRTSDGHVTVKATAQW
ncbi:MaoC family dehydratase N-terminal domain-containing protein [Mesorhizobium sp. VK25A]|uniref:MaoC family dehydratase N-terminal domain-containing protein n=1 Tax=Mesorhizobium vachelliae TaxID=3072309 RepID=A0ABU5A8Z4_9HYPH|nr:MULTISPECIES: MaoC family dehydratase N-terminal domain-containing protein [unclassified Mesorhizobium]MDX8534155.1 MaoC family dehydratase N-terminal domain-containing protein [Mesorhizobium sp. VK25D]MDX8546724.1 MaoC family dehydratase N-terminal domain-containing protein [Mesorhizobium sp. VK25A]